MIEPRLASELAADARSMACALDLPAQVRSMLSDLAAVVESMGSSDEGGSELVTRLDGYRFPDVLHILERSLAEDPTLGLAQRHRGQRFITAIRNDREERRRGSR